MNDEHKRKAIKINKSQQVKNKKVDAMSLLNDGKFIIKKEMLDVNIQFDFDDIDSDEELKYKYGDKIRHLSKHE